MKLIRFARELYENGRSVDEIRHACAKYGPMPARSTVQTWVSEERRERRLMQQRLRWRTANPNMSEPDRAIDVVSRRMRQLREAGLPYTHISSVLELDFGVRIHHERIRYAFRNNNGELSSRDKGRALNGIEVRIKETAA